MSMRSRSYALAVQLWLHTAVRSLFVELMIKQLISLIAGVETVCLKLRSLLDRTNWLSFLPVVLYNIVVLCGYGDVPRDTDESTEGAR